jgi:hypothetical protein
MEASITMPDIALSDKTRAGIRFLADMRLVTIEHFANASSISARHAGDFLHASKLKGYLGQAGGIPLGGQGRAPKIYFLTRKGWDNYTESEEISLPPFVNARPRTSWSQSMGHRLQTVSIYQALQHSLTKSGSGELSAARFDFRKGEFMGQSAKETMDFISANTDSTARIIPDAAFCLERQDGRSALVFVECDMGTEAISSQLAEKLQKYCQYYRSGRFADRYSEWGRFRSFIVLLVTSTHHRVGALRMFGLPQDPGLSQLFLLATHEQAETQPLQKIWQPLGSKDGASIFLMGNE